MSSDFLAFLPATVPPASNAANQSDLPADATPGLRKMLAWAEAGWPVDYGWAGTKTPMFKRWQFRATTDRAAILADWPGAIARARRERLDDVATLVIPGAAGCFILDEDNHPADGDTPAIDGAGERAKLETQYGFDLSKAPTQRTKHGVHYFLGGEPQTTVGLRHGRPGIDIKGGDQDRNGCGYAVAYSDEAPCAPWECMPVPPAFLASLGKPGKSLTQKARTGREADALNLPALETPSCGWDHRANMKPFEDYLSRWLAVLQGGRDIALYKLCAKAGDFWIHPATLLRLLYAHPAALGDPELDEDTVLAKIVSGYTNRQNPLGCEDRSGVGHRIKATAENANAPKDDTPINDKKDDTTKQDKPGPYFAAMHRGSPKFPVKHDAIEGYLPETGFGGPVGERGTGKSILCASTAVALALDMPEFWGRKVRPGYVVVVAVAEDPRGAKARLDAALAAAGKPWPVDRLIFLQLAGDASLDVLDAKQCEQLSKDVRAAIGPDGRAVLIVDTYSRVMMKDASDDESAKLAATHLDAISVSIGGPVIPVFHARRGSNAQDPIGSTTLATFASFIWSLNREGHAKERTFTMSKSKNDVDGWTETLIPRDVPGIDAHGIPFKAPVFDRKQNDATIDKPTLNLAVHMAGIMREDCGGPKGDGWYLSHFYRGDRSASAARALATKPSGLERQLRRLFPEGFRVELGQGAALVVVKDDAGALRLELPGDDGFEDWKRNRAHGAQEAAAIVEEAESALSDRDRGPTMGLQQLVNFLSGRGLFRRDPEDVRRALRNGSKTGQSLHRFVKFNNGKSITFWTQCGLDARADDPEPPRPGGKRKPYPAPEPVGDAQPGPTDIDDVAPEPVAVNVAAPVDIKISPMTTRCDPLEERAVAVVLECVAHVSTFDPMATSIAERLRMPRGGAFNLLRKITDPVSGDPRVLRYVDRNGSKIKFSAIPADTPADGETNRPAQSAGVNHSNHEVPI